MTHPHTCLRATQVSVRLVPVRIPLTRQLGELVSLRRFYASVYDHNFPSLVTSLLSWRSLSAATSYFLHTAINFRPPSVKISTHTSASNAVASQPLTMPNARMSLCTQSVHPPRPLRTAPSRGPNMIRFDNHPPLIRISAPAHKSI